VKLQLKHKNQQKKLTCLRGRNKFVRPMLFFPTYFVFCCFTHSFKLQFYSLWVIWHFVNGGNLIYSRTSCTKFYLEVLWQHAYYLLCPLMSSTQKRDGKEFCGEVFFTWMEELSNKSHSTNGEHYKLGMPHGTPLDISNSPFAHLSTLFCRHHSTFA
jgi:hypothetical protein